MLAKFGQAKFGEAKFGVSSGEKIVFPIGFQIWGKLGSTLSHDPLGIAGIYQRRKTKRGQVSVKMKFYKPTNPRTPKQQANRSKFADAMSEWQSLTDEKKQAYTKRANKRGLHGHNLFIREYYQRN